MTMQIEHQIIPFEDHITSAGLPVNMHETRDPINHHSKLEKRKTKKKIKPKKERH